MCVRVKLFDKDTIYGSNMQRFFKGGFADRIDISIEVIDSENPSAPALKDLEERLSFGNAADIYLVDMSLYGLVVPMLDLARTIILKESSDMTQLSGVRVIQKYQRPLDILVEIENMNRVLNADYNRRMKIKDELTNSVRVRINADATLTSMSDAELMNKVRNMTESKIAEMRLSDDDIYEMKESVIQNVYSSIRGYGILDALLEDESITEIMINGYDNIFLERDGRIVRHYESFESSEQLEDMIQKIVGKAGREVNHANPIVDTRLPDGSRVNVVLPPVALKGPTMTIRKFSKDPMSMDTLLRLGSITDEAADFLNMLVRARYNIFISGGTGSGKTTFLNALSNFIPKTERIITIEDSAELKIEGIENLVSMETRNANAAGSGEIPMKSLIKSSLRMRPDRIIVGEVRGIEALDMLQAMNTGHDGSLSTGHANSSEDMLSRLETMILQNSDGIPLAALRRQIASSLDIIIHLSRMMDHTRKVFEISEVMGVGEDGNVVLSPLYRFENGRLMRTENVLQNTQKLELAGLI